MAAIRRNMEGCNLRRSRLRGLTLVELAMAAVIIATVLVVMGVTMIRATDKFSSAKRAIDEHWIANSIMNQLVSEELPAFGDANGGLRLSGTGTYREFLENILLADMTLYEERQLEIFDEWRYEWTKELVLLNEEGEYFADSAGSQIDFGQSSEAAYDEYDDPLSTTEEKKTPEELARLAASRVIKITLSVFRELPEEDEGDESSDGGKVTQLMTYIDTNDFKEEIEDSGDPVDDPANSDNNNNNSNGNNNGNNNNNNNNGGNG